MRETAEDISIQGIHHFSSMNYGGLIILVFDPVHQGFKEFHMSEIERAMRGQVAERIFG